MEKIQNKTKNYSVVAGFLAAVILLPGCDKIKKIGGDAQPAPNKIVFIKGSVKIEGKEAKLGQFIGSATRIETGENSICEIVFNTKNIVHVEANTEATLNFAKTVKEIQLTRGGIASVLKNLEKLKDMDAFRIRTVTTVAGVRGTTFYVHADGPKTYICDCNGSVSVSDLQYTKTEILKNTHHSARVFSMDKGKVKVEEGTLEYHDDKMMEEIALKIDTKIDWTKQE